MRIMREAQIIAAQFFGMGKAASDIGFAGCFAGLFVIFMHTYAAQKNIFSIQQDLLAAGLDGAEPNPVADPVGAECKRHLIEFRVIRMPKLQGGRQIQRAVAVLDCNLLFDAKLGDVQQSRAA